VRALKWLKIPGMTIGFVAGLLVGALAAVASAPANFIIIAALGLGIPLAIFGVIYDALLDAGKLNFGYAAPTALFGVLTFPIARLVQEVLLTAIFGQGITLQQESGVLSFLAYQAIMGFGYGIGFLMIHNQIIEMSAWRQYRKHVKEERANEQPRAAEKQA
jgi:predicted membrane protein